MSATHTIASPETSLVPTRRTLSFVQSALNVWHPVDGAHVCDIGRPVASICCREYRRD